MKKNTGRRGPSRPHKRRNGNGANQVTAREPQKLTKSRLRWEAILQAAIELFNRKGFHSASMQDIADLVGIKKGSLYYYVDTKEELLFQILRDLHQGGEALVAAANFRSIDPLGELRSLLLQMGIYAGAFVGPVVLGTVAAATSYRVTWIVAACSMALAACGMLAGYRMLTKNKTPEAVASGV